MARNMVSNSVEKKVAEGELSPEQLVEFYRLMYLSRRTDDREIVLKRQQKIFFQISCAGHEALLVAAGMAMRPGYDWFYPYYRDQALMLGLGETPEQIFLASTGSADDPSSGGRQMPSHWGFPNSHVMTVSSATGSQCIPAVGCAEATTYFSRHRNIAPDDFHDDEITMVALGDGACSQGEFWEAI
ncbi:MAG TPA: thiamine pyrophosphate-dependent enzyme, partial [Edaphobacter sp.]|uniref:thiamine pyrophosphate-dependent enzyme n=1 Tax=Edaphobacter sp. TaxID=1934404 RepID=UPI002BE30713